MRKRKISRPHLDLIEIISKVAEICKLNNIEYVIEVGYVDYFIGEIHKVEIKGLRDGVKIKKCVIIKWHTNPADRECFRGANCREFTFYKHIVPALLNVQRTCNIIEGLKMKFPNCIFTSTEYNNKSIAVLIAYKEYYFFDRFNKIDLSHGMLVIKSLAKLHALSFALSKLDPEKFEEITKTWSKDVLYGDINIIPKSLQCYFMESVSVVTNVIAREKLKDLAPNILLILNKCTSRTQNYSTICHADCWNNNLIFKYLGQRPVDCLLTDFQLARYASPVTDLSYFFYMSTDRNFLEQHYDHLINLYYGTLSAVLRQCNLFAANIYPRSIFDKQLNEYSIYGLVEAFISMKILTAASDEAIKMTEMRYQNSDQLIQYELENKHLYIERINSVVDHFFERKYSMSDVLNE